MYVFIHLGHARHHLENFKSSQNLHNDQIKNEKNSFEKELNALKMQVTKLKYYEDSYMSRLENVRNDIENTKISSLAHQNKIVDEYVIFNN